MIPELAAALPADPLASELFATLDMPFDVLVDQIGRALTKN
jgi:hypothetical protein